MNFYYLLYIPFIFGGLLSYSMIKDYKQVNKVIVYNKNGNIIFESRVKSC